MRLLERSPRKRNLTQNSPTKVLTKMLTSGCRKRGRTKGGVYKRKRAQTNAHKCRQRRQTRMDASKRKQTRTNKIKELHPLCRVFLNPWFGEPVVCTLDSRGFRHFRGFRDVRESSTQFLVCSCPLSTVNPVHEGFSMSGAPFFGLCLADPAAKG